MPDILISVMAVIGVVACAALLFWTLRLYRPGDARTQRTLVLAIGMGVVVGVAPALSIYDRAMQQVAAVAGFFAMLLLVVNLVSQARAERPAPARE